ISGSDCHGSPVLTKAREIGKTPKQISDIYHREFIRCFNKLGFSFDIFTRTDTESHINSVKNFILDLYKRGYIYEKEVEQYFCEYCSNVLEYESLKHNKCKSCGNLASIRSSKHLFLKVSEFEKDIRELVEEQQYWRENAIKITKKYLDGGLRDRVVTGEVELGIEVPIKGFSHKRIYVWIDALMGYLTATMKYIDEKNENFKDYWNSDNSRVYLIHGKENIPFHTIVFPSILFALGINKCNVRMFSSEYLTLEGKTFSTNRNWVIWAPYMIDRYSSDSIRYYMIRRGPETKDSDFTWRDFVNINNNELLGVVGNFVNKTLVFIEKNFNGILERCKLDEFWKNNIENTYKIVGKSFEEGNFKEGINYILNLIEIANEFFHNNKPWQLLKNDRKKTKYVIYVCAQIIGVLSDLMNPIIPNACKQIREFLNINNAKWYFEEIKNIRVKNVKILFERIDRRVALEELKKLKMKKI
ncbi:MAG: methionine--tRNA ligase, partial [Sarcina sp.]